MKKFSYLVLFFISFYVSAQQTITKNIGDFSTLKVYRGIQVELIASNEQKIEISGDKADKVTIRNNNNTLKISLKISGLLENGEVFVKLFYNKDIAIIDANEGATITGKNIKQESLEVKVQERAFINLVIAVKYLTIKSISGGIIKITGTSTTQTVDADLYGVYHGFGLLVKDLTKITSGTGARVEVSPGKTLKASVSFGGTVFYKGETNLIQHKKVAGGIIQKRN